MCVIIDTNQLVKYVDQKDDGLKLLRQRIEKNKIKLIFPHPGSDLRSEYKKYHKFEKLSSEYRNQKWVKIVSSDKIKQAERDLQDQERQGKISFQSNPPDFSILVLAKASGTKLLASKDQNLGKDFTNPKIIGGKVYKDNNLRSLRRLLDNNKCPS